MKFNIAKTGGVKAELVFEDRLDTEFVKALAEKEVFSGKAEEVYFSMNEKFECNLLIGLGKEENIEFDMLRKTFFKVAEVLLKNKVAEVELNIPKLNNLCNYKLAEAIAEGMLHATYKFDKFKSEKKETPELIVNYNPIPGKEHRAEKGIDEAKKLIESIFLTRDLVNQPANVIYP